MARVYSDSLLKQKALVEALQESSITGEKSIKLDILQKQLDQVVNLNVNQESSGGMLVWKLLNELTKYTLHASESNLTSLSLIDPL